MGKPFVEPTVEVYPWPDVLRPEEGEDNDPARDTI